jgi:predicted histidine transporter YuiF (NhaC family)
VAVVAGLAGGNGATAILLRALIIMVICYPVGLLAGLVCQYVVDLHLRQQAEEAAAAASEQSARNAEEARDALVV